MGLTVRYSLEPYTYADYVSWAEDTRYELIDGVAYAMTAPSRRHQEFLFEIGRQLGNALDATTCRVYPAPFDVRLPGKDETDSEIETVVQPDISVFCDLRKLDEKGARGAPDWVIEILSPTTASRDHIVKRQIYERAGVKEYWLVHPGDGILIVYSLVDGVYGKPDVTELSGTTTCRALPHVSIEWDSLPPDIT